MEGIVTTLYITKLCLNIKSYKMLHSVDL